jgi:hypothetical protein
VRNINIERDVGPRSVAVEDTIVRDSNSEFTAGEFFKEAGEVIAVCLGLGLLTQILLG